MANAASNSILNVQRLTTDFATDEGRVRAVDDVSFELRPGEVTGLVGESGCGKSVTALSIMGLIRPPGRIVSGAVWFEGKDMLQLPEHEMRGIRGNEVAMVFQEPMTSLNPTMRVGEQVAEALAAHRRVSRIEARDAALAALRGVGIPSPEDRARYYPHQLSGGMRQRVMIAMALVCRPTILIADEPTTALDVTIQAQILDLLLKLRDEYGLTILLITHDLGVVAEAADRVVVMYAGKVVEEGPVQAIFDGPLHPYVAGLLRCAPQLGTRTDRLQAIPGAVPNPLDMPQGCWYAPRCAHALDRCRQQQPPLAAAESERKCACWLAMGSDPQDL